MGSEAMTYAEMKGLGYGTVNERLGKVTMSLHQYCEYGTLTSSCKLFYNVMLAVLAYCLSWLVSLC